MNWISVKERLPTIADGDAAWGEVLAWDRLADCARVMAWTEVQFEYESIAAWMPLPAPPEVGT